MKRLLFFTSVLTLLFTVSCTKTTTTPAITKTNPNPITGLWVGTYQIDDAAYLGSFYYSANIFSDSTIIQDGGGASGTFYTSKGNWTLHDSLFTATLTATDLTGPVNVQVITAIYDSTAGTLSNGKWRHTDGGTQTGTFSMKRVN